MESRYSVEVLYVNTVLQMHRIAIHAQNVFIKTIDL